MIICYIIRIPVMVNDSEASNQSKSYRVFHKTFKFQTYNDQADTKLRKTFNNILKLISCHAFDIGISQ